MSSELAAKHSDRKRELDTTEETPEVTALTTAKRQKLNHRQQENFPPSFWDNLSRLFLTTRSLREFDRRTVWPSTPVQPHLTGSAFDLTKLVQFAEEGGPNLEDLKAYPGSKEASIDREEPPNQTMAPTSAYTLDFQQHLVDNGCYPPLYPPYGAVQPQNHAQIVARLESPITSSPAFTQQKFSKFLADNKSCLNEPEVMLKVIPTFAERKEMPNGIMSQFNSLKKLTPATLVEPKPDWHDGVSPDDLALSVRDHLKDFIVPSSNKTRLCLPNFLMEVKGPGGGLDVLQRQALFAGVLGARGVHELRHWLNPQTLDDNNKAYTIVATYEPTQCTLVFYAIHPTRSNNTAHQPLSSAPGRYYTYRMTKLKAWMLDSDLDTFNKGMWAFQNAREWAKEQRDRLCAAANLKASSEDAASSESSSQESADELGMDGASS
ncbi:MAG: hypothetical protein L6R42_008713 [Xanthoria sp. 1 TBL-2021]|nr:MAG: hypothetical protein L6R42_008713 [Xanthoria sp. 1 TBL-2021]